MKRIAKIAVAATVLVAVGILVSWMVIGGGSTNIAFARVADALDSLRSATYDMTSEAKGERASRLRLRPGKDFSSLRRANAAESSIEPRSAKTSNGRAMITIVDGQAGKASCSCPSRRSPSRWT